MKKVTKKEQENIMRTAVVIVNYNDADTTIERLEKIKDYADISGIVVVDNNSSDLSALRLKHYIQDKKNIALIRAKRNYGYSGGNNRGIKVARKIFGAKYVLVANPDADFENDTVKELVKTMKKDVNMACIAPIMKKSKDAKIDTLSLVSAFPQRTWIKDLASAAPITRRIFNDKLNYRRAFYNIEDKNYKYVHAVAGSLLLLDIDKFIEARMYDENVFLYEEESILAYRLKKHGFKTAILLNKAYIHKHSVSIKKSISSLIDRQKIRECSTLYYYKNYLKVGILKLIFSKLIFKVIELEVLLFYFMQNMVSHLENVDA